MIKKKKNPQDSTIRNVRSINIRMAKLMHRIQVLEEQVMHLIVEGDKRDRFYPTPKNP